MKTTNHTGGIMKTLDRIKAKIKDRREDLLIGAAVGSVVTTVVIKAFAAMNAPVSDTERVDTLIDEAIEGGAVVMERSTRDVYRVTAKKLE